MSTHRSLPTEIDAIQFTGDNVAEIWDHFGSEGIYGPSEKNPDHLILTSLHGPVPCRAGGWVVAEPRSGHFYPITAEVFAGKYREVSQASHSVWQNRHSSIAHFEQVFTFSHLPIGRMRDVSQECARLAAFMVENLPDNQELTAGLRALWEAKNCFVLLASGKFDSRDEKS
jgi:hypothetical protein